MNSRLMVKAALYEFRNEFFHMSQEQTQWYQRSSENFSYMFLWTAFVPF